MSRSHKYTIKKEVEVILQLGVPKRNTRVGIPRLYPIKQNEAVAFLCDFRKTNQIIHRKPVSNPQNTRYAAKSRRLCIRATIRPKHGVLSYQLIT